MDETTKMFEAKLKNMNEKCAIVPYRTRMISRNVRALDAFLLVCFERSESHGEEGIVLGRQTHNGQVTENHDLRTVVSSVEERSGNTIFIGNSDGREEGRTPRPRRCHTGGS